MDSETIKTLMKAMDASDLAEMEFTQDGWTLRLSRHARISDAKPVPPVQSKKQSRPAAPNSKPSIQSEAVTAHGSVIESPMFGMIYLRPNPDAPDFIAVGAKVSAGTTVCLIESMKMFIEVKAVTDGVVEKILVHNGDEVEAGQSLIILA